MSGEHPKFMLVATGFDCLECREVTFISNKDLAVGVRFNCGGCGEPHEFVSRDVQWGYALVAELNR